MKFLVKEKFVHEFKFGVKSIPSCCCCCCCCSSCNCCWWCCCGCCDCARFRILKFVPDAMRCSLCMYWASGADVVAPVALPAPRLSDTEAGRGRCCCCCFSCVCCSLFGVFWAAAAADSMAIKSMPVVGCCCPRILTGCCGLYCLSLCDLVRDRCCCCCCCFCALAALSCCCFSLRIKSKELTICWKCSALCTYFIIKHWDNSPSHCLPIAAHRSDFGYGTVDASRIQYLLRRRHLTSLALLL